jgi:F-type H+-transporting ATPase subunit c
MKILFWTAIAAILMASPLRPRRRLLRSAGATNWVAISAAFGMALAAFGGALAQSRVASSACEGMARNPGAAGAIRAAMILGLVFIETLALLTLVIIFGCVRGSGPEAWLPGLLEGICGQRRLGGGACRSRPCNHGEDVSGEQVA